MNLQASQLLPGRESPFRLLQRCLPLSLEVLLQLMRLEYHLSWQEPHRLFSRPPGG